MPFGGPVGPGGDPMMDPQAAMAKMPKPRRKVWREEKLVDDVFLAYMDKIETLPEPDLIFRMFLVLRRGERHLAVRLGDRRQPWQLPTLEPEISPAVEPEDMDEEALQEDRRERLDAIIQAAMMDTWQLPVAGWRQFSRVQMTARRNQDEHEPGARRYEVCIVGECGEPADLAGDGGWARRFLPARDMNKILRERYFDKPELMQAHERTLIEALSGAAGG